jgi:large subunit ribosomal protein L11
MGGFTKAFNDATKDRMNDVVPVVITAYDDRSFEFVLKTTPAAILIKKAAGVDKGAQKPSKELVGSVTIDQLREIAEYKLEDLNTDDIDQAISMLKGQCKNMGISIDGDASTTELVADDSYEEENTQPEVEEDKSEEASEEESTDKEDAE